MSLPSRSLSVQNHPHDQQICPKVGSRETSLCDINSRWRWRSAPTKSGWVPRLPRSWLVIIYVQRYGTEECNQAESAGTNAGKARGNGRGGATARRSISSPDFSPTCQLSQKRTEEQPCSDTSSTPGAGPRYRPAGRRGMCRWGMMTLWRRRRSEGVNARRWQRGYRRRGLAEQNKAQDGLCMI